MIIARQKKITDKAKIAIPAILIISSLLTDLFVLAGVDLALEFVFFFVPEVLFLPAICTSYFTTTSKIPIIRTKNPIAAS